MRRIVNLDELVSYARCPMEYCYTHVIQAAPKRVPRASLYRVLLARAFKSLVREYLKDGKMSTEKAYYIWMTYVKGTYIEQKPILNAGGRHAIQTFLYWLDKNHPVGLSIPRSIPVDIESLQLDIRTTADFCVDYNNSESICLVRVSERPSRLESALLRLDSESWNIVESKKGLPRSPKPGTVFYNLLSHLVEGIEKQIVWPYKDNRCMECQFRFICSPAHCKQALLEDKKELENLRVKLL